ncbi:MAG: NADH-quinone oxidoreductase subunit J family protein [Nocardioidaceae bacterium]
MTGVEVLFTLLGVLAVGSGVMVAVSANLVHCALWLVVTLGALAGCYLLLAAEFVAWVQVLIYLGAIVVLLLFALMLTRAPTGAVPDLTTANKYAAAVVALATGGLLITCFAVAFDDARITIEDSDIGDPSSIGATLFGSWVLAFELLSVILLAALIGAIVLSRRRGQD